MPTVLLSRLVLPLALLGLSTGCGALFNGRVRVSPQASSASARVDARVDPAAATLGSAAAAGLGALLEGGSADSQTVTSAVHTPGLPTASASPSPSLTTPGTTGSVTTGSGTTTSVSAAPTAVTGISGTPSGTVSGVTTGSVTFGRVPSVRVTRVVTNLNTHILGGGSVTLEGGPMVSGLTVVEGSLHVDGRVEMGEGQGASVRGRSTVARRARWQVGHGALLVEDAEGRRWRLRVRGGALAVATEGTNPQGNTVWSPGEGSLDIEVVASGDTRLALEGDIPGAALEGAEAGVSARVSLPPRALRALDMLVHAAPARSRESLRLAAAVDMIVRESQDAGPAVFSVPITGRTVVLLVDVSHSMSDPDPRATDLSLGAVGRPTKLDIARAELVKVLGSVGPDVRVNVVAFSSSSNRLWAAPQVVDDASLERAIRWVVSLRVVDETHPMEALEAAASMGADQIVLLSDGRPSHREEVSQAVLGLAEGLSTRVRIDVVGIGPDQDRVFLAALAARGGGILRVR